MSRSYLAGSIGATAVRLWQSSSQRIMSVTAFGMLLALLADILIAARFGTSELADAIIIAISFPRLVETVSREGTKFSLTAYFVEEERRRPRKSFIAFTNGLLNLFMLGGLIISSVSWLLAPLIVPLLGPGFSEETRILTVLLFRLSLPMVIFALASTVLGVLLNSNEYFVVVASRNMAIPLVLIITMFVAWNHPHLTQLIAISHVVGYLCYFLVLYLFSRWKLNYRFDWRSWPDRKTVLKLTEVILYPTAGFTVSQGARVVERSIATLVAPGGAAAYYFAMRLVSASQSIIGVSIAIAGLPKLARLSLNNDRKYYLRDLMRQVRLVVFVSLPLTVLVVMFAPHIVQLLYGRGQFDVSSVATTALILRYLALAIVFLSIVPILNSSLYVQKRYIWILASMVTLSTVNIALAWYLSHYWELVGIAVSVVLTSILNFSVLLVLTYLSTKIGNNEAS